MNYHINNNGEIKVCYAASPEGCPFFGNQHFLGEEALQKFLSDEFFKRAFGSPSYVSPIKASISDDPSEEIQEQIEEHKRRVNKKLKEIEYKAKTMGSVLGE